jgi:HlyD family secretion protein
MCRLLKSSDEFDSKRNVSSESILECEGNSMNRILKIAGIAVVVAGLAGGGYLKFASQPASAASAATLNTATVQEGTLTATVTSAGNITAAQQVALNFQETGVVQKVAVQVGDQVKAGQVLASLDTSNVQLQLQNAQVNLKIAQDKLAQAKTPNTPQDINTARAQADAAQAAYNKLIAPPTVSDLAAAQSAVTGAQAGYNAAVQTAGTSDSTLTASAAALQNAQATLSQAQAAYDKVKSNPDIGARPESVALQQATNAFNQAKANYDALNVTTGTDNTSKVQTAKATLDQAQAALNKLVNPNPQDVQSAKDQVTQAQSNLEKLLAGSDVNTLDIAQNGVDQAQIAVQQAQAALQQAEIVAPFDGVVTAVNATPGQNAGSLTGLQSTGAIQVADLSHLQIVVNMAETDVSKIKVGQETQITLDALPNRTFAGKVSLVAPAGTLTQGVVTYPVTIDLTGASNAVKSGMTANLNVIVAQHANVLMVPNRAVRTAATATAGLTGGTTTATPGSASGAAQSRTGSSTNSAAGGAGAAGGGNTTAAGSGNGQRPARQQYVTVLRGGRQVQVPVQTGLSNDTMTEVVSGLNAGDVVVLNATTTAAPRTGGGPGVGLPGVGRIG